MSEYKSAIFSIINEFSNAQSSIDWHVVFHDEELFDGLSEVIDGVIENIVFCDLLKEEDRERFIGKLMIAQVRLNMYHENEEYEDSFIQTGHYLEDVVRELIQYDSLIAQAEQRFQAYEKFEEEIMGGLDEVSDEDLARYRPVLLAIGLLSIITIDQQEEDHE